ncbi:serine hydrolase [Thiorhodospira sibirica]|uniref:serine hydrolase n=1 Tax=Thiorhodospira sibirica TaxID=154347 RepID=UPI00022C33F4
MMPILKRFFVSGLCATLLLSGTALANLQVPPPSDLTARNYILLDAHSGAILAEQDADARVEPASLTKIMTAYLVFQALDQGTIQLTDKAPVSEQAWRTGMRGASRMFIEVGSEVMVEDLLRGMIVQSGNDASVALAELIAGSEGAFVDLMNAQARRLGMHNSRFQNSHGLPSEEAQYSSARDFSILARALIHEFPQYYGYYSERSFKYGIDQPQRNRNLLLWRDSSVDGMKTGWTSAAGYCLVSSAKRDGMRLVSVVMGIDAPNHEAGGLARANQTQSLMNWGFRQFETHRLYAAGQPLTEARVWKGDANAVPVGLTQDLYVTIPRGRYTQMQPHVELLPRIEAPVLRGHSYGELSILLDGQPIARQSLVALQGIDQGGFSRRMLDAFLLLFH